MNLGMARERLGDDARPDSRVRELVDSAHRGAKDALVELRNLARGIHPPVLDNGLADALATLAASSAIPVELTTAIGQRPAPAIETIAYFCAAELLANAAKHSHANQVAIDVAEQGRTAGTAGNRRRPRRRGPGPRQRPVRSRAAGAHRGRPAGDRQPARWADTGHRRAPAARLRPRHDGIDARRDRRGRRPVPGQALPGCWPTAATRWSPPWPTPMRWWPRWLSSSPTSRWPTSGCRRPTPTRGCAPPSNSAATTRGPGCWCCPSTSRPGTRCRAAGRQRGRRGLPAQGPGRRRRRVRRRAGPGRRPAAPRSTPRWSASSLARQPPSPAAWPR